VLTGYHLEQACRLYLGALLSVVNQRATSSLCFAILVAVVVVLRDLAACRIDDCVTTFALRYSDRFDIVLLPFFMCAISDFAFVLTYQVTCRCALKSMSSTSTIKASELGVLDSSVPQVVTYGGK
jgi:hypothetical protein